MNWDSKRRMKDKLRQNTVVVQIWDRINKYMSVWVYDYMSVWAYERMSVWVYVVYECISVCSVWVHECMSV